MKTAKEFIERLNSDMYFKKIQRSLTEKGPSQGVRAFFKQGLNKKETQIWKRIFSDLKWRNDDENGIAI